jgi:hypothetical protein
MINMEEVKDIIKSEQGYQELYLKNGVFHFICESLMKKDFPKRETLDMFAKLCQSNEDYLKMISEYVINYGKLKSSIGVK